jgi:hypothetical protein
MPILFDANLLPAAGIMSVYTSVHSWRETRYAPTMAPALEPCIESKASRRSRVERAAAIPADTAPLIPPPSMTKAR